MRAVLLDVEERPDPVRQPTPAAARPPAGPRETIVDQAAAAVTRLHPVATMGGGVGGDEYDMNCLLRRRRVLTTRTIPPDRMIHRYDPAPTGFWSG